MLFGCEDILYLAHKDLRMTEIEQRERNDKRGAREAICHNAVTFGGFVSLTLLCARELQKSQIVQTCSVWMDGAEKVRWRASISCWR